MNYYLYMGRFQPPHQGHIESLKMLDKAAENGKSFIALTGTQDSKKNPLTFEKKYKYVKVAVDSWNLNIEVIDKPIIKIYDLLRDKGFDCEKSGGGTVYLFAGEDRVESYQKMADGIIKKYQARNELQNVSIIVEKTMNRDSSLAYSATQMRQHVIDGDIEEFIKHCPFKSSQDENLKISEEMFYDVEKGLALVQSETTIQEMYDATKQMAEKVSKHINQLSGEQDKLYYVGGCVRDLLMGKEPNDLDLVTTMYYKDFAELFKTNDIRYRGQNIIVVPTIEGEEYETACLTKGTTLEDRLLKSDITINAMAQDVITGEIIDPLNGKSDIENKIIKNTDFMIEAFSKGQQPVAFLRTIRFYSVLEDFELDSLSNDALFVFSEKTNGKLKVTKQQFDKDYNKVVKAGKKAIKKFEDKLKELGLWESVSNQLMRLKEGKEKQERFKNFFSKYKLNYNFINDNFSSKDDLIQWGNILIKNLEEQFPDFEFRISKSRSTYNVIIIDCTKTDEPNRNNVPNCNNKFYKMVDKVDFYPNNDNKIKDSYLAFFKNGKQVLKDSKDIENCLYFITRAHQSGAKAQMSASTTIQECMQGKAIENKIFFEEDLEKIMKEFSPDLSKIQLGDEVIKLKESTPEIINKFLNPSIKTAKAFYNEFKINSLPNIKVYHPDGKKDNPINIVINAATKEPNKFVSGSKDTWNPMDILVTNISKEILKNLFKESNSINGVNSAIRYLIKIYENNGEINPTHDEGLTDEQIEILKSLPKTSFFAPISLKINNGKQDSHVEKVNIELSKKEYKTDGIVNVKEYGTGFIFKPMVDGVTYKIIIRNNGNTTATLESAYSSYDKDDDWYFYNETEINVSKEEKNKTSQLGKAWGILTNYTPEFGKLPIEKLRDMTLNKIKEFNPELETLPTMLHSMYEKYGNSENINRKKAAELCEKLSLYILYNRWTTREAVKYILCASMKKNYGVMDIFAPLYKIS